MLSLVACASSDAAPGFTPVLPTIPIPTVAPPPTAPTSAPPNITLDPALQTETASTNATVAAREKTVVARATTSPFPTPFRVQTNSATRAETRRGGLSFTLELPKDTYSAGEGGRAQVTFRNVSSETLIVMVNRGAVLLDEQGHEPSPYPWTEISFPDMRTPGTHQLFPGGVVTETFTFQVPPREQSAGHRFSLWAQVQVARNLPDMPELPDNAWVRFEAGPIAFQVVPPDPSQQLVAKFEVDRKGWRLKVTDAEGHVPAHPMWGIWEAETYDSASKGPLSDNLQGEWSGEFGDWMGGAQIATRAWVAAPGYVTAAVTATVPGTGKPIGGFQSAVPPRQSFPSLESAQAVLDVPVYRPSKLLLGSHLDSVQVETFRWDTGRRSSTYQLYRLGNEEWLELKQMDSTERTPSEGWGPARWDPEAQVVAVGRNPGALIQQFGWWVLDWKLGDVGFELHAPADVLSPQELIDVGASLQS